MTDQARELYDLLFPEVDTLEHNVQWYQSLAEIGASSLLSALEQGFVPLRNQIAPAGQEEGPQFVHENSLPDIEELIVQVAELRLKQQATDTRTLQEAEEEEKLQRWSTLRTELLQQEDLSPDDIQRLEEFVQDCSLDSLELSVFHNLLESHRQSKAKIQAGRLELSLCRCSWCATQRKQQRPWLDPQQWERYLEILQELWPTVDFLSLAEEVLATLFESSRTEEILRCYYQAIHESLAADGALKREVAALLPDVTSRFTTKLEQYRAVCQRRVEQQEYRDAVEQFFQEDFQPRWKRQEESWRTWLETHLPDDIPDTEKDTAFLTLDRLLTLHYGSAYRLVQNYWGLEEKEDILKQLEDSFVVCQQEIEKLQDSRQKRSNFRIQYAPQSDVAGVFKTARTMKRQILFFCGPTNSGKTYAAFEELAQADSGVYLAPLRLLALEGQKNLLARKVRASFLTGEERDVRKGAKFVSSTIEMLKTKKAIGCAIIDEVQLLTHPQRGWAWVNALLGVPAYKVILTGSADAIPLVRQIAESLHEPFEVREFTRFNPLEVLPEIASLDKLEPGTAVICFSRRDVLGIKREIEESTTLQAAVIYGALSPDVRRSEARRFREGKADILVATDAIGMGLNLPIKTVLFWTLEKTAQGVERLLTASEIKQIAGRAGRYGHTSQGFVGAFVETDLERIQVALEEDLPVLTGPCPVMPLPEHIELIAGVLQHETLSEILTYFKREAWFANDMYYPMVTDAMEILAERLDEPLMGQPLTTKLTFARAPVSVRASRLIEELAQIATDFSAGKELIIPPSLIRRYLRHNTEDDGVLRSAEEQVQRLTLYRWLAYRFPKRFNHAQNADTYRHILNRYIRHTLTSGRLQKRCRTCGKGISMRSHHQICQQCYREIRTRPGQKS